MGKSKFPGKPSKVLQRKRVSVLRSDEKLVSPSSSSGDESGKGGGGDRGGGNNNSNNSGNGSSGNDNHNDSVSGCNEDKNNSEDNNGSKENGGNGGGGPTASGVCNSGDNLRNGNEMPSSNSNKAAIKSNGTHNNIFQVSSLTHTLSRVSTLVCGVHRYLSLAPVPPVWILCKKRKKFRL